MAKPIQFPVIAQDSSIPLLVSYEEAARLLGGVSVRYVGSLVASRKLKKVGRGKAARIVYSSIVAYVEREAA